MIRVTTEGEPRRHQVTEIPEINPHTTEYPCPQVVCEHGQKTTQEPLPEEVRGNFGPHLTALIAYWTVVCRVPRRLVEAMLADVLGLEISLGSTQKAWEEVSQAVEQPCQQWQEQLPREAVRNVAGTRWPWWPGCFVFGIGFAATCGIGGGIRNRSIGVSSFGNRFPCRRSCSPWQRRTWTTPTKKCGIWPPRSMFTASDCLPFSK